MPHEKVWGHFDPVDVLYGTVTYWESYRKYGEAVICVKKRQCGKQLCKKLNQLNMGEI